MPHVLVCSLSSVSVNSLLVTHAGQSRVGYGHRPRVHGVVTSGIAGLYDSFIFGLLKNLYTVLHSNCITLYSHQQCYTVSFSKHPLQHLLSVFF